MKAPNGSVLLLTCLLGNVLAVPTLPVGDLAAKRSTQLSRDTGAGAAPLDLVKKSGEPDVLFGEKFRREEAVEQTIQAAAEGVAAEAAELFPGLDAGDLLLPSHSLLSNGLFHGLGTSGPFSTILKSFVSAIKAFFSQLKAAQTGKSTSSDPTTSPTPTTSLTPITSLLPVPFPSQSSGAINSLRDGLEGLLKDKGNDVNLIQGLEGLLKGIGNLPKDLGNLLKPLGSKTDQGDSSKGLFKGLGN